MKMDGEEKEMVVDTFKLGNRLRELRENIHATQQELAEALEVSHSYYSRLEVGSRGLSLTTLYRLVDYYDTDANTILDIPKKEERKRGR